MGPTVKKCPAAGIASARQAQSELGKKVASPSTAIETGNQLQALVLCSITSCSHSAANRNNPMHHCGRHDIGMFLR